SPERLLEVLEQVLGGLDADREAQQAVTDPETLAILARETRVRSGRRARQERMHAPQARRDRRDPYPGGELIGTLGRTLKLEGEPAAEAGEQAPGALVPRVAFEPRVVPPGDGAVRLEKLCEPQ